MESLHAEASLFWHRHYDRQSRVLSRTELRTQQSTNYATPSIKDYDERRTGTARVLESTDREETGDPRSSRKRS